MTSNKLSVIVPIYNAEEHLEKCLDSICNQTYKKLQIILVNDGSNDDSLYICNTYKEKDNRVEVYSQNNKGVSSARNLGLEKAEGDYITFVDADDFLDINTYKLALNYIKNYDAVFFSYKEYYPKKNHFRCYYPAKNGDTNASEAIYNCIRPFGYDPVVWNKIIKKEIISDNKFDVRYGIAEDWLWIIKVLERCSYVYLLNTPLYNYVQTEESAWRSGIQINEKWDRVFDLQKEVLDLLNKDQKNYIMAKARFYNDYHQLVWRSYLCEDHLKTKYYNKQLEKYKESFYNCKEYSRKKKFKYSLIDLLIKLNAPKKIIYEITKLTSYKTKTFLSEGVKL